MGHTSPHDPARTRKVRTDTPLLWGHDMDDSRPISIVIPVLNEAENLRPLYEAVCRQMDSPGGGPEARKAQRAKGSSRRPTPTKSSSSTTAARTIRCPSSANWPGRIAESRSSACRATSATSARQRGPGIRRGDAVIVMDADLQHPPELIPQMLAAWRQGNRVVYTIREDDPRHTGRFERGPRPRSTS